MIRLFEAPYGFVKRYNYLCDQVKMGQAQPIKFRQDLTNAEVEALLGQREESAKKQPLGLMNKPQVLLANKGLRVEEEEQGATGENFDPINVLTNIKEETAVVSEIQTPPVEEVLMTRTLWPES